MAQTPTTDDAARHIARIDRLTDAGRVNWFGLMAYLVFVFITMLGVEDADFFIPSRQTQLPLVNVAIPTESFFVFAPILGAALYVYLHLTVRKITGALCAAPPAVDGMPLEHHLKPWLLVDLVLRWRNDGAIHRRPLDTLATLTVVALVWLAGPLVLAGLWMRTWPAHDEVMTMLAALSLIVTVYAGAISWVRLRRDLRGDTTQGQAGDIPLDLGLLFLGMAVLNLGWIQTETGALPSEDTEWWATLAPAQMRGVQFSALPPDQADPVAARQRYRAEWCARLGMPPDICGSLPTPGTDPDATLWSRRGPWCQRQGIATGDADACRDWFTARDHAFRTEWTDYRQAVIAALPKPDLSGRDLRGADMSGVEAVGIAFRGAKLQGADLQGANLERTIFTCDRKLIEAGDVLFADLEDSKKCISGDPENRLHGVANLTDATLENANLSDADLRLAVIREADLKRARLDRANLRGARMENIHLAYSRMVEADLNGAFLEGASFYEAKMDAVDFSYARATQADFDGAQINVGIFHFAVLNQASFVEAQMDRAFFYEAQLKGADLAFARMRGADFSGATMFGADLRAAQARSAIWDGPFSETILAQFADLRGGTNLDQARLSQMIGNAATLLPEAPEGEAALYIPSCWAIDPPGFEHLVSAKTSLQFGLISATRDFAFNEEDLRDPSWGFFCAPGEVPRKTGTPLAMDGDLPWQPQAEDESDFDYRQRVEAWVAGQPPGAPID